MQVDLFLGLVGQIVFSFILALIFMFIAIYFATRIVTNRVVSAREALIGAVITVAVYEAVRIILFFVSPSYSDWIGLAMAAIVLLVLLLKYYNIGLVSTIALVMLSLAIIFAIAAFRTVLFFIF